ncbi:MAG: tRNA 2-thiouridine(34) synthase MnmA, partial [Bdellovibrionales bacterium]|nr:tRNA 2-thiouridine(34) synthase MnmA [Bdellovibrionales bacterium]
YGQRKRLGVYHAKPLYVVKIDGATQEVWLGEEEHLYQSNLRVKNVHWLDDFDSGEELRVKIRFQHPGATAKVLEKNGEVQVNFAEPQRSITPGQAAVFYRGNRLVGGGWIL